MRLGRATRCLARLAVAVTVAVTFARAAGDTFEYVPAPPDNPLKGFVPYAADRGDDAFPHSMEFSYFALGDLMAGDDSFTWEPLDKKLAEVAGRGRQLVFRVYLEYPGKPTGLPDYLADGGVGMVTWERDGAVNVTPDYEDPKLRSALGRFVHALGERYDSDPRIGYITAGLLGLWGECHNYPNEELFASREVQEMIGGRPEHPGRCGGYGRVRSGFGRASSNSAMVRWA